MGGFARYPWPQYLSNPPFYYNKYWKRATLFAAAAGIVNYMVAHRYLSYHTVQIQLSRWSIQAMEAILILHTHRLPQK